MFHFLDFLDMTKVLVENLSPTNKSKSLSEAELQGVHGEKVVWAVVGEDIRMWCYISNLGNRQDGRLVNLVVCWETRKCMEISIHRN